MTTSAPGPYTCTNCGALVAARTSDGYCSWCARGQGPSVPTYPHHVKRPGWPDNGPPALTNPGHP
jgi:hypothetical protein